MLRFKRPAYLYLWDFVLSVCHVVIISINLGVSNHQTISSKCYRLKLRLPICEIFQLFRSLVYFILPFTDVQGPESKIK